MHDGGKNLPIEEVEKLFKDGQLLKAYDRACAPGLPALRDWQGAKGRILAGRLVSMLGDNRLGSAIHWINGRENPTDIGSFLYYSFVHYARFSPLKTYALLDEFIEAGHGKEDHVAVAELLAFKAFILAVYRDFHSAESLIKEAEALAPESPWVATEHAVILSMNDRNQEALEAIEHTLVLRPFYRPAVRHRANFLMRLNRDDEAISFLNEAATHTESPDIHSSLSLYYSEWEETSLALKHLDEYERLTPLANKPIKEWIAGRRSDFHYLEGDFDKAIAFAKQAKSPFHKNVVKYLSAPDAGAKKRVRLPVGFVRQHSMTCAPATLTALMNFWGKDASHLDVAEEICYDGTPGHSERNWAHEQGMVVREFRVTKEVTHELIDRGIPFTLTTVEPTSAHLQAVIGYDDRIGVLIIRDPTLRHFREFITEGFIKDYAPSGPRGMVFVPKEKAQLLEGIVFPDAEFYDRHFELERALARHDRATAEAKYSKQKEAEENHLLTHFGSRALSSYDDDPRRRLEWAQALHEVFPKSDIYRLQVFYAMQSTCTREERLTFIEKCLKSPRKENKRAHPVFYREFADMLSDDGRMRDQALRQYHLAARSMSTDGSALMGMASIHWRERHYHYAKWLYRLASTCEEKWEHGAQSYFNACQQLNCIDEGVLFLRQRVQAFGRKSSAPHITLIRSLENADRLGDSFEAVQNAINERPDDGELLLFAARHYADYGQLEVAGDYLEKAKGKAKESRWLREAAAIAATLDKTFEAKHHLRTLLKLSPQDLGSLRSLVRLIAETEGNDAAILEIQKAAGEFPNNSPIGELYVEWLRYTEDPQLEEVIRGLIIKDPLNLWAQRELAMMLSRAGRHVEAIEAAETALAIDGSHSWNHSVLAIVLSENQQSKRASHHLREALKIDIDNDNAITRLINLCESNTEKQEAAAFLTSELSRQVITGDSLESFRQATFQILDPQVLLDILQEARSTRPDLYAAWSVCVDQLCAMNRFDEALTLAQEAVRLFPYNSDSHLSLSEVCAFRNETEDEINALQSALRLRPNWSPALRKLSMAYEKAGKIAEAIDAARTAVRIDPLTTFTHGVLADLLWNTGQKEEAFTALQKAIRISPGYEWGWGNLAPWCRELQRTEDAIAEGKRLVESNPNEARSWNRLADIYCDLSLPDEREKTALRGLEIHPKDEDLHLNLALALYDQKKYDDALAACSPKEFQGQRIPRRLRARGAWIRYHEFDKEKAIKEIQTLVEQEPDYYWAVQQLAEWLVDAEKYEESVPLGRQMIRLAPQNEVSYGYVAQSLIRLDRWDEAVPELERALQISPTYLFAGLRLAEHYTDKEKFTDARRVLTVLQKGDAAPGVFLRLLQLEGKMKHHDAMVEAGRALARSSASDESFETAARDFFKYGGSIKEWQKILTEALLEGDKHTNELAGAWVTTRDLKMSSAKIANEIETMKLPDATRGDLWERWLNLAVNKDERKLVLKTIDRHAFLFRTDPWLWSKVTWACNKIDEHKKTVAWCHDWQTKKNVQSWAISNLAAAIESTQGLTSTSEDVRRRALEIDPKNEFSLCCLAFREAERGNVEAAEELRSQYNIERMDNAFYGFIHSLTGILIACRTDNSEPCAKLLEAAYAIRPDWSDNDILRQYHKAAKSRARSILNPRAFRKCAWKSAPFWKKFVNLIQRLLR